MHRDVTAPAPRPGFGNAGKSQPPDSCSASFAYGTLGNCNAGRSQTLRGAPFVVANSHRVWICHVHSNPTSAISGGLFRNKDQLLLYGGKKPTDLPSGKQVIQLCKIH